jgi:hypothetical protein
MRLSTRTLFFAVVAACLAAMTLSAPVAAEDLSDNATCLECHGDGVWTAPENSDRPRIHNDDGSFTVEDHEAWSCIDCHDYITEIPHPEGVEGSAVDCTNCHETTPTVE